MHQRAPLIGAHPRHVGLPLVSQPRPSLGPMRRSSLDVPSEDDDLLAQLGDLGAHRCQLGAAVVFAGGTSQPIRGLRAASRSWRRTASRWVPTKPDSDDDRGDGAPECGESGMCVHSLVGTDRSGEASMAKHQPQMSPAELTCQNWRPIGTPSAIEVAIPMTARPPGCRRRCGRCGHGRTLLRSPTQPA